MSRFFAVFALVLTGCGNFTFTTQLKGEASIQGSPLGGVLNVFPQLGSFSNINFDQNQDFKNNDARRDMVKETKCTSFAIRIVSPSDQDFAFLESLEFAVKSGDTETVIARKTGINTLGLKAPNPTLILDLPGEDISQHVRAENFTIISRATGRQPNQDVSLEATVKFLVGVGL